MLRLGPQLTFLSRVLRPVVVVAVAHKLYTERRPCMVSQQQQQQKQQKQQYRTLTTTSSILHDGCFKPKCLRVGGSAFGLLSFVTLLLFLSFAESFFFLGLPTSTVVVAVVMDQAQAIAMCAVRLAPVDESVSVQILHEADASSCRGR